MLYFQRELGFLETKSLLDVAMSHPQSLGFCSNCPHLLLSPYVLVSKYTLFQIVKLNAYFKLQVGKASISPKASAQRDLYIII